MKNRVLIASSIIAFIAISLSPLVANRSDYLLIAYTILANILLGLTVLLSDPENKRNRYYFAFALFISLWALSVYLTDHLGDYTGEYIWSKVVYSGTSLMIMFLVLFVIYLVNDRAKLDFRAKAFLIFPGVSISLLALFTDLIIRDIFPVPTGSGIIYGPLYPVHSAFVIICLAFSIYGLITGFIRSSGVIKTQLGYVLLGIILSSILAYITNVILPMFFKNFAFAELGPGFTMISLAFIAYAITKHRLMDISIIISRALAEVMTVIFLGVIYLAMVWLYITSLSQNIDFPFITGTVLYGIIVGLTHQKIRLFLQTTSDKVFLKAKYNYYQELSGISSQITRSLSIDNIRQTLHKAFYEVLEVSNPAIYLEDDLNRIEFKDYLGLKEPVLIDKKLVLPCRIEDRLIALIILGPKLSEDPFTDEDLRLLKNIANQTAIALEYHRMYEEMLKTQKQLLMADKLAALGKVASGFAEEARMPLSNIRKNIQMIDWDNMDAQSALLTKGSILQDISSLNGAMDDLLRLVKNPK